jgi:transposase
VGLTDAKRRAALELYAGLDVSAAETSVCVVDADGKVIRETKVPTEPEAIIAALAAAGASWKRIGLEAGPLSQWLFSALVEAGYPAICVETRHMKAALSARINKSDRNDARGIAQMMRVGLYRPVHVKALASQERRLLLTNRRLLQDKMLDIERELRGTLRNFGPKVGIVSRARFEARVEELVTPHPRLAVLVRPLLAARRALREQFALMHKMLLDLAGRAGLPAADDGPGRRRRGRAGVPGDHRRAGPLRAFQGRRRRPRPDAAALPVGRARPDGPDLEVRRRHAALAAVRGGPGAADPRERVVAEGVGPPARQAAGHEAGDRRHRPPALGRPARDVDRGQRLPFHQAARRERLTGGSSNRGAERDPPTGGRMSRRDRGPGEFVVAAVPARLG